MRTTALDGPRIVPDVTVAPTGVVRAAVASAAVKSPRQMARAVETRRLIDTIQHLRTVLGSAAFNDAIRTDPTKAGADATMSRAKGPHVVAEGAAATNAAQGNASRARFDQDKLLSKLAAKLEQASVVRHASDIDDVSRLSGRALSAKEADTLVARFAASPDDPFSLDACYALAHVICNALQNEGIACAKMWIHSSEAGVLKFKTDLLTKCTWGFHVAAIVYVKTDKGIQPRIIDPVTSVHALKPAKWIKSVRNGEQVTVDLTHAAQMRPRRYAGVETDFAAGLDVASYALKVLAAAYSGLRKRKAAGLSLREG